MRWLVGLALGGCLAEFPAAPVDDAGGGAADARLADARPGDARVDRGADLDAQAPLDGRPLGDARLVDARVADARVGDAREADARVAPPDARPGDARVERPDTGTDRVDAAPDATPDAAADAAPDAAPCEPLACTTLAGLASTSPCAPAPTFACLPLLYELCQCGRDNGALLFDVPPGTGQPFQNLTYVHQPAANDSPHVRVSVSGVCLAPVAECEGQAGCAGHRAHHFRLPQPLVGIQAIEVYHHNSCRLPQHLVLSLALVW